MKRNAFILACLITLFSALLSVHASAQIVDYSDEYVSFSYDDEMLGKIHISTRYDNDHYIEYDFDFADKSEDPISHYALYLQNKDENYDEAQYGNLLNGKLGREPIFFQNDEKVLIFCSMSSNTDASPFKQYIDIVFDSLVVPEVDSVDSSKITSGDIFMNVNISDQASVYAQTGVDILNKYMKMELSPDEAADQISTLVTRIDNYLKNDTEYYFDREIKYPFSLVDLYLSGGKDDEIINTINKLESLIGSDE